MPIPADRRSYEEALMAIREKCPKKGTGHGIGTGNMEYTISRPEASVAETGQEQMDGTRKYHPE